MENDNFNSEISHPHNRILFGAPGTGKSYKLKNDVALFGENCVRVTFHPDYSYAHFVGTYKPTMDGNDVKYEFVPGPFLTVYKKARKNPNTNYCLVIEEINRANVAAVFGDVFQLLDRDSNGESEYPVMTSKDAFDYLTNKNEEDKSDALALEQAKELKIPSNMYIWASMNSADQGVYPMDTAFKRRWTFEYVDIDEGEENVEDWSVSLPKGKSCKWNALRKAINIKLVKSKRVNEDKCLGPRFVKETECNNEETFISKVLMYLFEDVVKQKPSIVFSDKLSIFSEIRKEFKKNGLDVFNFTQEEKNVLLGEEANRVENEEENN